MGLNARARNRFRQKRWPFPGVQLTRPRCEARQDFVHLPRATTLPDRNRRRLGPENLWSAGGSRCFDTVPLARPERVARHPYGEGFRGRVARWEAAIFPAEEDQVPVP